MPVLLKDNKTVEKAHKVYEEFAADSQKMAMIEAREKWEKDNTIRMNTSWRKGRAEGKEEGMEQGIERKAMEDAKKMLAEGAPVTMIERVTGLSREVILKFQEEQE